MYVCAQASEYNTFSLFLYRILQLIHHPSITSKTDKYAYVLLLCVLNVESTIAN